MASENDNLRSKPRVPFLTADKLVVRYKFLSHQSHLQCPVIFQGHIKNLSLEGTLLSGSIPGRNWLDPLRRGAVLIAMNIIVPNSKPVKALSITRWTRLAKDSLGAGLKSSLYYHLGVQFFHLEPKHRANLEQLLRIRLPRKPKNIGEGLG